MTSLNQKSLIIKPDFYFRGSLMLKTAKTVQPQTLKYSIEYQFVTK